jgi:hypothetical protein
MASQPEDLNLAGHMPASRLVTSLRASGQIIAWLKPIGPERLPPPSLLIVKKRLPKEITFSSLAVCFILQIHDFASPPRGGFAHFRLCLCL